MHLKHMVPNAYERDDERVEFWKGKALFWQTSCYDKEAKTIKRRETGYKN